MKFERRPDRSPDSRLIDLFTRRETEPQRRRRILRRTVNSTTAQAIRAGIPEEVMDEIGHALDRATFRTIRRLTRSAHRTDGGTTMKTDGNGKTTNGNGSKTTNGGNGKNGNGHAKPAVKKPAVKKTAAKKSTKTKASKKAKVTKSAKSSDRSAINRKYTASKLDIQKRLKIGSRVTYHGRVGWLHDKLVQVKAHEGLGGVIVALGTKQAVVSPFALLPKKEAAS